MARYAHLPIFKQVFDLAVAVEKAVRFFPRYHKYTLGSDLRGMCHEALALIAEANSVKNRADVLSRLRIVLERVKIYLMPAREVQAFNKAKTFYRITEMAVTFGNI